MKGTPPYLDGTEHKAFIRKTSGGILIVKALVFGSMNIDCVYRQDHIVRPGETLASAEFVRNAGGKGLNQAIAMSRAGLDTWFAGQIGEDGLFLKELLGTEHVHTDHIRIANIPTGSAMIQVDAAGQNAIVLYGGANQMISKDQIRETLTDFGPGDLLLMQNEISHGEDLLCAAKGAGMTVAVNPSPVSSDLVRWPLGLADWLILNEIEGAALSGSETPEEMFSLLEKRYPGAGIVLTLGENGSMARDRGCIVYQGICHVPTVDTTAAGDTFTGYFLKTVMTGGSVTDALAYAAKAAAIAVSRTGAAASIPRWEEIF